MADFDITLKRHNGGTSGTLSDYDNLRPTTTWTQVESKPTTFTPTSHTHGNILDGGSITSTTITPANNDRILIADDSNSGKIERGIIIGTATDTFLRNDGQWGTPAGSGGGNVNTSGTITTNTIPFWASATTIGSLATTTYPSLTELSYVKGVTSALQTQLNGKASTSHTHPFTDITGTATTTQLPTITIAKGGTGQTSYSNSGGVMYYNSPSGIISAGGAASQNAILQATGYNGVHYFGNWVTPSTLTASLEAETTIATLAANTLSTVAYTVTGYRFAHIWLSNTNANTTTTIWNGRIDLSDTNQRGTTTGNQRFFRIVWNNGTSTFADNLEIYSASSTSIQFRHSAGITMRYRIVWEV